jgi:hypothetical protein
MSHVGTPRTRISWHVFDNQPDENWNGIFENEKPAAVLARYQIPKYRCRVLLYVNIIQTQKIHKRLHVQFFLKPSEVNQMHPTGDVVQRTCKHSSIQNCVQRTK